ncbi:uncharacterized protein LOC126773501, partial [Nymphalis io]|uniref:uncharacterized protein LOC126773501 n=1 Tax=Inachis io TaxID=171585 RepID=UPI002167FA7D
MELMSSLLLCALVTLVPQALGNNSIMSTGINETSILSKTLSMDKNHIVTIKVPSSTNKISDLKSVFMDATCKSCLNCMERAIKSHKVQNHIDFIKKENFRNEFVTRKINTRNKRKTNANSQRRVDKRTKKSKSKNNKLVTVIKYNENERIFALKIIETNKQVLSDQHTNKTTTCQVYSVKKYYPCETLEADLILNE